MRVTKNYEGGLDKRAAWRCCRRIASDACRVDLLGAAARVAADLGNTALRAFQISGGMGEDKVGDIRIPPLEKFHRCFLCFWCRVGLEKVNNEFMKFFATEPIIMAHPVGGVSEIEVKLGRSVSWVERR